MYDLAILLVVEVLLLGLYESNENLSMGGILAQGILSLVCIFAVRFIGNIYGQIWRYGGIQCYIRLLIVDGIAFVVNLILENTLLTEHITFARLLVVSSMNLLGALAMRMVYRYAYKCGNSDTMFGRLLNLLLRILADESIIDEKHEDVKKNKNCDHWCRQSRRGTRRRTAQ